MNTASGIVNSASSGIPLRSIPNYLATLQVRFSHTVSVQTQNAKLYIYDRSSINNNASGVTTKVAELIHPNTVQTPIGSGDTAWQTPGGSSVIVNAVASPGSGGYRPNGASTSNFWHDWFFAISASPDSIGSKNLYGLYFSCEYL